MMSLLTELDLFCDRNLQRCQPYGLEKSVFIGVHPWLNSFASIVHPKMKTGKEPFQCGIRIADCGVVEQQSNEATKLCRLGCLVPWLFKIRLETMRRFKSDFRHRPASCVRPAPRCPCGIHAPFRAPSKIARPFMAGTHSSQFSKVPSGTKGLCRRPPLADDHHIFLPSLARLLHLIDDFPSHRWLGYCHRVTPCAPLGGQGTGPPYHPKTAQKPVSGLNSSFSAIFATAIILVAHAINVFASALASVAHAIAVSASAIVVNASASLRMAVAFPSGASAVVSVATAIVRFASAIPVVASAWIRVASALASVATAIVPGATAIPPVAVAIVSVADAPRLVAHAMAFPAHAFLLVAVAFAIPAHATAFFAVAQASCL